MPMFSTVESWDWSGRGQASGHRNGLARASWNSTTHNYTLDHGFSRIQVIQQLQEHIICGENGHPALIGFDFPFSFPFEAKGNQFVDGSTTWVGFSATVQASLQPDGAASRFYGTPADYGNGGFSDHFAHLFRGAGNIGPNYVEAYRATENNAHQHGCPASSVFRLVNPMVGVQALAGIQVLRTVLQWCIQMHFPLTIWPLGHLDRHGAWQEGTANWNWHDHGVVIVESYPRVSFHRANIDRYHFGDQPSVHQAAANLGLIPGTIANHVHPATPDERDALIVLLHLLSPAWFRAQIRPDLPANVVYLENIAWLPPHLQPAIVGPQVPAPLRFKEGNIFGV